MKDILLVILAVVFLSWFVGSGSTEISPDLQNQVDAALFRYSPTTSNTTIENQTNIDRQTNIERQYIITQVVPSNITTSIVDSVWNNETTAKGNDYKSTCITIPGDIVTSYGSSGECYLVNNGSLFFVAPTGVRTYIRQYTESTVESTADVIAKPTPFYTANDIYNGMPTDALRNGFVKAGGNLPFGFRFWSDEEQRYWLLKRLNNE